MRLIRLSAEQRRKLPLQCVVVKICHDYASSRTGLSKEPSLAATASLSAAVARCSRDLIVPIRRPDLAANVQLERSLELSVQTCDSVGDPEELPGA